MTIDMTYLLDVMKTLLNTPSPVGYYEQMKPAIERLAAELGYPVTYDTRETADIPAENTEDTGNGVFFFYAFSRKILFDTTVRQILHIAGGNISV